MEADEELARRLQEEFDNEARNSELQSRNDALFAQKIAKESHNVSDSESDDGGSCDFRLEPSSLGTLPFASNNCHTSLNDEVVKSKTVKRPVCKFGADCYRENPIHLAEFYHPEKTESSADGDDGTPKRSKTDACISSERKIMPRTPFEERLRESEPLRVFLNKIYDLPETHHDARTLVFPDLLTSTLGTLIESAQLNFVVDLEFVMKFYKKSDFAKAPLLLVYGRMEGDPSRHENLTCSKAQLPYQYGVHHTKMMLFRYEEGVRVVVHTANLVPDDWDHKTQGFWVSPLFPPLPAETKASLLEGESRTRFKRDLTDYLLCYRNPDLGRWARVLRGYDFSSCSAFFVGSAPGYHVGERRHQFGHMKCRALLRKWSKWAPPKRGEGVAGPLLIAQCSSIGSLGKDAQGWLNGELGCSLSGGGSEASSTPAAVKLIYPSQEDVRNSCQGYGGGSCLPYNSKTHEKQLWLRHQLHCWRSGSWRRTGAMPHIKSYARLSADRRRAQYFLLTSANLSKAAWGQLQKQGTQLFVRSYEAGVLLLPELTIGEDSFALQTGSEVGTLKLPYDLPLTPYPPSGVPWFMNTAKKAPDIFGNTYP